MPASGTLTPTAKSGLLSVVERESGQRITSCYQCGKCTAGCPIAHSVDLGPRQVMRAVQLGLRSTALSNQLIWLCLSCQTCTARCPREIDVAGVMEALRILAVAQDVRPAVEDANVFHKLFLASVKRAGRLYELGVGGAYNLLTGKPLNNVTLLPKMLARGKLGIIPERAEGAVEVRNIFDRVAEVEGQLTGIGMSRDGAKRTAMTAAGVGLALLAGRGLRRRREETAE